MQTPSLRIPTQRLSNSQVEFRSRRFAGTDPDHGVRRSVATTAHFEMEPCPYILGASSSSAWEQCPCFLCPTCMQLEYFDTYYHHNVSVARCFVSLCQLLHGSPNNPLQDESMPQYFRGIFHSCMGTMDMLFASVINLVWKLQDIANNLINGVFCQAVTSLSVTPYVAPTAHFKLKPHPNTLQASSTHTLGQGLYFLGPMCMQFGNYNIGS